jgi:hypothetical protein
MTVSRIRRLPSEGEIVRSRRNNWFRKMKVHLLESYVEEEGPLDTKCWMWTGALDRDGYGKTRFHESEWTGRKAHREAYRTLKGDVPDELEVQHLCNNRACINPDHLVIGTNQQNKDYMVECDRSLYGERNTSAKLTEDQVKEVHRLLAQGDLTQSEIGELFGMAQQTISQINRGARWSHIPAEPVDCLARRKTSSRFFGVRNSTATYSRGSPQRWTAGLNVNREYFHLGSFGFEEDAAIAYNYFVAYLGLDRPLNQIPEDYCAHD